MLSPNMSHKKPSDHTVYHDYQLTALIHTKIQTEIQRVHKRTLYSNDTENKCSILRSSHLHQSIQKPSNFVSNDLSYSDSALLPLDATDIENGYSQQKGQWSMSGKDKSQ
jgi:hypothetical protein